ncbi:MAG: PmbA/TldA family metallopeptidase, partial [Thermoleophilaceae bacterium]
MNTLELAERAVAAAPGEALAHVVRERSLLLRFADSRATQATSVDDVTVELAVLRDGHVGRASTNDGDEEALVACARRAAAAAEAAAAVSRPGPHPGFGPLESRPHPGSGGPERARRHLGQDPGAAAPAPPTPPSGHDPETAALAPEPGGAALAAAFAVAERHRLAAHGIWTAAEEERAVATSSGGAALDRTTDAFMKVICIAPGGRSGYA